MAKRDILDIVEGAYETTVDLHQWLVQANDRFASRFPAALAPGGYVISKTPEGPPKFHAAYLAGVEDAMTVFDPMHENMDRDLADAVFLPGTHCITFSELWAGIPPDTGDESPLTDYIRGRGGNDLLFASSFDRQGTGVLLGAVVKDLELTDKQREIHRRAAVHMAAGWRLRAALAGAPSNDAAEAVFEVDGRLAHAQGAATAQETRSELQEAVKRVDRARTAAVRRDEMEALGLWQGLVEGRWSLIDRYDTDGRRYYVAIANPPLGVAARQLTEVESQVVSQVIAGEPNGVIAYSLGVSESTVAGHLGTSMRKLGAGTRIELVRLGRALGA